MKYEITDAGCWNFNGCLLPNGYGKVRRLGKTWLAHRLSYTESVGEIPDGVCVLHKCDNRKCINPAHLFLGSRADNMKDMISKGRQNFKKSDSHRMALSISAKNQKNRYSKISMMAANEIRHLYSTEKAPQKVLAEMFGVNRSHISRIVRGESWRVNHGQAS